MNRPMLSEYDRQLSDPRSEVAQQPQYCKNPTRSIKPGFLVAVGICTHLGCVPTLRPPISAPTNLVIPRHGYLSDSRLIIGTEVT